MDLIEKYHLKIGTKIRTNGNLSRTTHGFEGKIIHITNEYFYVGNNSMIGSRPRKRGINYYGYKHSWVIRRDNCCCYVIPLGTNAKDLNI